MAKKKSLKTLLKEKKRELCPTKRQKKYDNKKKVSDEEVTIIK